MPLENEMDTPRSFGGVNGVLNQAMVLVIVLYVAMGLLGYLRYGNDIKDSVTLSLPEGEM